MVVYLNALKKIIFSVSFALFFAFQTVWAHGSNEIAVVHYSWPGAIRISITNNYQHADCLLMKNNFTKNIQWAKIHVAIVDSSFGPQKTVAVVSNRAIADKPDCLLR